MYRGYTYLYRKIWSNAILAEPGRRFSRLEAWLYITNMLAAEMDDQDGGLKRGEFTASIRQLANCYNWSIGAVHRFLEILLQNSMIMRIERELAQQAGHFVICNYETYNTSSGAGLNTEMNTESADEQIVEPINACECGASSAYPFAAPNRVPGGVCINNIYNNIINTNKSLKDTHTTHRPAARDVCVSPQILLEIYQQHNQSLPEVKALTSERLRKCRSRINQAVRDGCLEQYLADFAAAVQKAQQTPFLRGEGARGWRAGFDWFVANQVNMYAVLEGKYDGAVAGPDHGGENDYVGFNGGHKRVPDRTSRGYPIYIPRQ